MLTKEGFVVRMATIMAEFTTVMNEGEQKKKNQFVVDGTRLLAVIENLTGLLSEIEPQVVWPNVAPLGLPYN